MLITFSSTRHQMCFQKHKRLQNTCYIYLKYFSITVLDLHAYLMGPWMLTPHQLLRKRNKQNRRINYLRSNWPTCYLGGRARRLRLRRRGCPRRHLAARHIQGAPFPRQPPGRRGSYLRAGAPSSTSSRLSQSSRRDQNGQTELTHTAARARRFSRPQWRRAGSWCPPPTKYGERRVRICCSRQAVRFLMDGLTDECHRADPRSLTSCDLIIIIINIMSCGCLEARKLVLGRIRTSELQLD